MYSLIGHPLGHSMSPFIHKKLFELSGKAETYELCDIEPDKLQSVLPEKLRLYDGLNVTIPYKLQVIDYIDELDVSAKKYNSVNCIAKENGKLIGYNTDCIGFLRSVPQDALGGKFLLAGCGGVGRMMALEAAYHGGDITIAVRKSDLETAKVLAGEIKEKFPEISVRAILLNEIEGNYDLFVNATPVGMYPNTDACPVSEEVISKCKNIFDAIYNPKETVLIKTGKKLNINSVGGMRMLVLQAVAAHEIWYGAKFSPQQTDKIIEEVSAFVENNF